MKNKTNKKKRIPKRLIFLAFVLAGAVYVYLHGADIAYNQAKMLYDQKQYAKSLQYFEIATLMDKDNLDAYYYYARALNSLPMTYDVQKRLFRISHEGKSGAAATLANTRISKYRYFILTHAGGNYIQQVPYQDKVLHWNPEKFPIKVYIEPNDSLKPYYITQAKNAFGAWNKATKNFIRFEFVKDPSSADIDYRFIEKDNAKESAGGKFVLAYAEPTLSGNKLKKFDIRFSTTDERGKPFSVENVYLTSIHEIGHALGIMGHSFYENNIMYPSSIEDKSVHAKHHARGITAEDLNTLKLLYAIKPEITNSAYSEKSLSKMAYAPVILGDKKEINNKKIEQAKQYIQNAPELPNGYMDLASAYYELENYQESLNNLYQALLRTHNNDAKYPILYNMTITYFEARDYNHALDYAQMASNIKSSTEINAIISYLKFKIGNKTFGIKELESLLAKEPGNIDVAQYLTRAYLENGDKKKAGETLKRIKQANPEAATDPRIQQFGLLNLFNK